MRKPQYAIAPELPLVLHSCEFESLKFICSAGTYSTKDTHVNCVNLIPLLGMVAYLDQSCTSFTSNFYSFFVCHVLAVFDIAVCSSVNYFIMFELLISLDARQALHVHFANQCRSYQLQAAIFHEALLSCLPISSAAESNITIFFAELYDFITLPPSNIAGCKYILM